MATLKHIFDISEVSFASASKRAFVRNHSFKKCFRKQIHFHADQDQFHIKGFARGLVLKQRHKVILKYVSIFAYAYDSKEIPLTVCDVNCKKITLADVGFEPTSPKRLVAKNSALDPGYRVLNSLTSLHFIIRDYWLLLISDQEEICHKILKD